MRSTLLWLMSRSCQRATFSSDGHRVAAQHAREAGEAFPRDGVALVRHGAAAFLAFGERFFGFEHFGALQVAELHRPTLDARADEGHGELKFGVDVALHDLRGDGRGAEAQLLADVSLDAWRQVRARADCAGDFADGHDIADAIRGGAARGANSSCISASFRPKVVGSPWMPWLRPMQGVNLCSFARRAMTGSNCLHVGDQDVRAIASSARRNRCRPRRCW